jgi:hypothetical protein
MITTRGSGITCSIFLPCEKTGVDYLVNVSRPLGFMVWDVCGGHRWQNYGNYTMSSILQMPENRATYLAITVLFIFAVCTRETLHLAIHLHTAIPSFGVDEIYVIISPNGSDTKALLENEN